MKPKTVFVTLVLTLLGSSRVSAQEQPVRLSLKESVQMAVEKNINVQTARIEEEKGIYKISETRSKLLPQINIGGSFQDNLQLPTTLLPGEIIGQPGTSLALQMGSNYTTSAAATLNLLLYNQTALTGLRLSKKAAEINTLGVEKASEELANEVAKLYFLTLTTAEQKKLVEENIARTQRMKDIIELLVGQGMGRQVDYDRINVNMENLYTQLSNVETTYEQQLNMIKYMLEIPLHTTIMLTDTAEMSLLQQDPQPMSDFSNHIDIQILESQKDLNLLNQKMVNHGYIPSLSFTGQFAYQGLRQEFKNYFKSNPENKWYPYSYVGLNLSIPIFDGLEKRAKSRQAKLDYLKTTETLDNTKERFSVNYQNAVNNYQNNKNNVQRQKQNIALAEKVYVETSLKYREGLSTMSDLLQDEMGLSNAQSGYLNALYNFKESELKIMSLNGDIKKLINN